MHEEARCLTSGCSPVKCQMEVLVSEQNNTNSFEVSMAETGIVNVLQALSYTV